MQAREAINKFEIRTNRPEILSVLVNLSFERTVLASPFLSFFGLASLNIIALCLQDVEREMTSVLLSESLDTMLSSDELYDGKQRKFFVIPAEIQLNTLPLNRL